MQAAEAAQIRAACCVCLSQLYGLNLHTAQAYAAAQLTAPILRGLQGEPNIYGAAYVECGITEADFFASKV
jgi:hypothetical protein